MLLASLAACDGGASSSSVVERTVSGDTTTVVVPLDAATGATRLDSLLILWRDPSLSRPQGLIQLGSRLVINDRTRLHLVGSDGSDPVAVGREGEGPGEFGAVSAIGAWGDTLAALDPRNRRFVLFNGNGKLEGTHPLVRIPDFINPRADGTPLVGSDDGVLVVQNEVFRTDRITRVALVWHPLGVGEPRVLRTWDHIEWVSAGQMIVPRVSNGPVGLVAVSVDGRVAWGDGQAYEVLIESVAEPSVLKLVRESTRVRVTPGARSTARTDSDMEEELASLLQAGMAEQEYAEFFPSFDRMLFGVDGRLWVRTLGADAPDVNPFFARREDEPAERRWESFDSVGEPAGGLLVPREFTPYVFDEASATGILETESGELVLAKAFWTAR